MMGHDHTNAQSVGDFIDTTVHRHSTAAATTAAANSAQHDMDLWSFRDPSSRVNSSTAYTGLWATAVSTSWKYAARIP